MYNTNVTSLYESQAGLANSRALQLGNNILKNGSVSDKDPENPAKSTGESIKTETSFLDILNKKDSKPVEQVDFNKNATETVEDLPTTEQEAVQQFVGEAFFGMLMKQMRNSVWKSDLLGGSSAQSQFEGQLDQFLVQNLAESSSDRISKPFYEQMQRNRGT